MSSETVNVLLSSCAATSCVFVEKVRKATTNRTTLIFGKNDSPSSHANLSKNLRNRHGTQYFMPSPEMLCSEDELERELHRARSAHFIQRTQDAQRIRERAGSLAESRACAMDIHIAAPRIDSSKARMVEYIEGLCPELQLNALVDRELPANRHVKLPSPEAADKVSGNIAGPGTYGNEGVRIDRPAARAWKCRSEIGGIHPVALQAVNVDRMARNNVQAVRQSLTRKEV